MTVVVFIQRDKMDDIRHPKFIENKTAHEIFTQFAEAPEDCVLGIKTPTFISALHPNAIPQRDFPQLIQKHTDHLSTDYAFQFIKIGDINKLFLIFEVHDLTNSEILFPPYVFGFVHDHYVGKKNSEILSDMVELFGLDIINPTIFLDNHEINMNGDAGAFIQNAKNAKIEFRVNLTPAGCKTIRLRESVLKELIQTEASYCCDLSLILNYFGTEMSKLPKKELTKEEYDTLFDALPKMLICSANFATSLQENKILYSSSVSRSFLIFAFAFHATQQYIVDYDPKILNIVKKLANNKRMKEVCEKTPENPSATLGMYLIKPIQRMPRYLLLIRELINFTPESHPDFMGLQDAHAKIEEITHEMENASEVFQNRDVVKSIQDRIFKCKELHLQLVTKDRVLIMSTFVYRRAKKRTRGTLYLFNDLILLTVGSDPEDLKFYSTLENFVFLPNNPNEINIKYYYKDKLKGIEFFSMEIKQKFLLKFAKYRDISFKHLENISLLAREIYPCQFLPQMVDCSCAIIGHTIFFLVQGTFITFDGLHKSINISNDLKSAPLQSKIVVIDNKIYLYGGKKSRYILELVDNKKFVNKGKRQEERTFHSCVAYMKSIVVYGGLNKKGKLNKDDFTFYKLDTQEWTDIKTYIDLSPPPRYGHSAVVFKNIMIIHGGKDPSNKVFDDTWCYNFSDNRWRYINLKRDNPNCTGIVPRFLHSAVVVNKYMIILGGITQFVDSQKCFIVNLENWTAQNLDISGNYIFGYNRFAAAIPEGGNQIFCCGGTDSKIYEPINSITTIEVPEQFSSEKEKPNNDQIIFSNDMVFVRQPNRSTLNASPDFPMNLSNINKSSSDIYNTWHCMTPK
ncbi:hypothetical protein TRFO_08420 [Tritrichomonas foetus]|uniref:DH domain-containing protein n=1 Tax=Tritrichomonas foetus TaxID=1144522 RepID=A0A1J4JJY4_9EUKA|nr:hypothetical protein TRFO_08420 [Tritrichomonas foetus]|eukprot:OHS99470.1 hypothetical protein TRFO_08420 [Tritrichomonas foetus]